VNSLVAPFLLRAAFATPVTFVTAFLLLRLLVDQPFGEHGVWVRELGGQPTSPLCAPPPRCRRPLDTCARCGPF